MEVEFGGNTGENKEETNTSALQAQINKLEARIRKAEEKGHYDYATTLHREKVLLMQDIRQHTSPSAPSSGGITHEELKAEFKQFRSELKKARGRVPEYVARFQAQVLASLNSQCILEVWRSKRKFLGRGSHSWVHMLETSQGPVAAKTFRDTSCFDREYSASQRLDCPYVSQPWASFREQKTLVFPMYDRAQWYLTGNMQHFCANLLMAINHAHSRNIYHNDIKPDNIWYDRQHQRFLLGDWSCSSIGKELRNYATHEFVAPECRGRIMRGTRSSDLYSLGQSFLFFFSGVKSVSPDLMMLANAMVRQRTILDTQTKQEQNHPIMERVLYL